MNNWTYRWEDRYSKEEFTYGTAPNNYLKEQIEKLNPGTILFPAEGEGRNAVFAAKLGWKVSAFDISEEVISQLENLLNRNKKDIDEDNFFKPMSIEEFNNRIDQSEDDFKNGRYKSTSELLEKYK